MIENKFKSQYKLLLIVLSSVLFAYILIRAHKLSFTHDESLSFSLTGEHSAWRGTANNHELNTELMTFFRALFGTSEFSLRLPNVLAFLVFIAGASAIFKPSKHIIIAVIGIGLLVLNPFLIEFFSLARGYGLSIGFMTMSMYFIIRNINYDNEPYLLLKDFSLGFIFAGLAMFSNLTTINFYICSIILFIYKYWLFHSKQNSSTAFKYKFLGILLVTCYPLFYCIKRLLELKNGNQLYFGSKTFFEGVDGLIFSSLHFKEYFFLISPVVKTFMIICFINGIIFIASKKRYNSRLFLLLLLNIGVFGGIFMEGILFHALYPMDRTALFYIPLIAIFIYELINELFEEFKIRTIYLAPLFVFIATPVVTNFLASINFTYTTTWKYDAHTKNVMARIKEQTKNSNKTYSISNHWLFEPTINYYIQLLDLNMTPANRNGINNTSDFIYRLENSDTIKDYSTVNMFDDINAELLIKNEGNE